MSTGRHVDSSPPIVSLEGKSSYGSCLRFHDAYALRVLGETVAEIVTFRHLCDALLGALRGLFAPAVPQW